MRVFPFVYKLEGILTDGKIRNQQLGPRVYDAHAVLRGWLSPSTSTLSFRAWLWFQGERDSIERSQLVSYSSRVYHEVTTIDANVDHVDFGEEENSKSEDALTNQDTDHINITPSASEDKIVVATTDISAVKSKSTVAKDSESANEFILARETFVCFVQDSIAEAVDLQKLNADKNERANVLLFNIGDLVLLSTVNLP